MPDMSPGYGGRILRDGTRIRRIHSVLHFRYPGQRPWLMMHTLSDLNLTARMETIEAAQYSLVFESARCTSFATNPSLITQYQCCFGYNRCSILAGLAHPIQLKSLCFLLDLIWAHEPAVHCLHWTFPPYVTKFDYNGDPCCCC
jgi:hypothetical protein